MRIITAAVIAALLPTLVTGAGPLISLDPSHAIADEPGLRERIDQLRTPAASAIPAACCKTCRKGYACGDSCISRTKQCHKGVGCACDG